MALHDDDVAMVRECIEGAQLASNLERLSEWERGFLQDQETRWNEYGEETRFSSKQLAIMQRIWDKMNNVDRGPRR